MLPWLCILMFPVAAARLPTELEIFRRVVADVDRDGNGTIEAEEYARVDDAVVFALVDVDGSGGIDAPELARHTAMTEVRPRPGAAAVATSVPGGSGGAGPADGLGVVENVALGVVTGVVAVASGIGMKRVLGRKRGLRRR